jgi:guanylate kinase
MSDTGIIFILSSPSGGGKSSISKKLIQDHPNLWLSISTTTRAKRQGEAEGQDYYFIDKNTYEEMKAQDQFLESAKVYDHYYGTPKQVIVDKLVQGTDVLFDIDWQGAKSIRQATTFPLVSIFILPPSLPDLQKRLLARGDNIEIIQKRMQQAQEECSHCFEYDYIVINNDFNDTIDQISMIMKVESLKFKKDQIKKLISSQDFVIKGL